ncbi:MAG: hypothetical protein LBJ14_05305 [Desulfarculales bacterium]|jgi:hypothetical protein|nr:hypothetical protein [Desulfarculales bacterium]
MKIKIGKKYIFICAAAAGALAAGAFAYSHRAVNIIADPEFTLNDPRDIAAVRRRLQHGDWLVVRGIHMPDNFIASVTNMPLSHAAIFDALNEEVLESDSNGVHTSTLEEFMSRSQRLMIIEPAWATQQSRGPAVERARGWLGQGYNYTGLVGINSPNRFYCTQLAVDAYKPFIENGPNPLPAVIKPGQMYHWGRIVYDTGPVNITGAD